MFEKLLNRLIGASDTPSKPSKPVVGTITVRGTTPSGTTVERTVNAYEVRGCFETDEFAIPDHTVINYIQVDTGGWLFTDTKVHFNCQRAETVSIAGVSLLPVNSKLPYKFVLHYSKYTEHISIGDYLERTGQLDATKVMAPATF